MRPTWCSSLLPPWLQNWSLAFAIPFAFVVAAIVGVAIERLIIRYLYTRPLETLLATWGVSLILQQAGAQPVRRQQPAGHQSALHVRRLPSRRPRDHDQPAVDHRAGDRRLRRAAARPARHALRAADAGGDAEPPHGGGDGHFDRASRHARLRARLGRRRASPASRCRRSTTSRPISARATSSTASWSWCSAASAICGARRSAR